MAKRKKKSGSRKTYHRKKVGAIKNDGSLEAIAGGMVGLVAAQIIVNQIPAQTSGTGGISDYAIAAIEVAAGGALGYFADNWFLKGIGIGIAADGLSMGLQTFGVISGVGTVNKSVTYNPARKVAGYRDVNKIGDFPKPNTVGSTARSMHRRAYGSMYKN